MMGRVFFAACAVSMVWCALPGLVRAQPSADLVVRSMEERAVRAQRLLAEARARGREDTIACVDVRLSELNATLRQARERADRGTAHDRSMLVRLHDRSRELELAAQRCVDPEAGRPGTVLVVTIDRSVPEDAIEISTTSRIPGALR